MFRTRIRGGEGLARFLDGERVIRPGLPAPGGGGGDTHNLNISGFVGSERELAAQIDVMLTRRKRAAGLGFA